VRFRDSAWDSIRFEPERFFDIDEERVLVFVRATATGSASAATVETNAAHEFAIRDGLVVRVKIYADRAEALDACGVVLE
jgi:ketosteroid isomerase-like protein